MDNATTMATPHPLMTLDKQNMAKTSLKLAASDSCGDVCAAECPVNAQKVLVVTFSFWQGEVVRICQSYWRVTLTSAWKMITTPKLQIS
jgi:hypothetical protein